MEIMIALGIALLSLFVGSITDIRSREVPDWLSHGTIYLGFAVNLLASIIYWDWTYILFSILGFGMCFLLGLAMYKLGQWGGGDTKVIMGIGALIGLNPQTLLLVTFLLNTILVGAAYGILWSLFVALRNWKQFWKAYRTYSKTSFIVKVRIALYLLVTIGLVSAYLLPNMRMELFGATAVIFFLVHFWIIIKIVEQTCMIKDVPVGKVTEGDWIVDDIVINGKVIAGPADLGISMQQIKKLKQHKIKKVKVKYGVPFVPSFFIAFLLAILFGAWYLGLIQYLM